MKKTQMIHGGHTTDDFTERHQFIKQVLICKMILVI